MTPKDRDLFVSRHNQREKCACDFREVAYRSRPEILPDSDLDIGGHRLVECYALELITLPIFQLRG